MTNKYLLFIIITLSLHFTFSTRLEQRYSKDYDANLTLPQKPLTIDENGGFGDEITSNQNQMTDQNRSQREITDEVPRVNRATKDTGGGHKEIKDDDHKTTTKRPVVLMPGLPGLPGMPGLPGQASLQRAKSQEYPSFNNCSLVVEDGVVLCDYSQGNGNSEPIMQGTQDVSVKSKSPTLYNVLGLRKFLKASKNRYQYPLDDNTNNNKLDNYSLGPEKDESEQPLSISKNADSSCSHGNSTYFETSTYEKESEANINAPINIDRKPETTDSQRFPVGPGSRQINLQQFSMNLEDSFIFPNFFRFLYPLFHFPRGPGVVFGSPGMPGQPGLPGTPGTSVITSLPSEEMFGLERASRAVNPVRRPTAARLPISRPAGYYPYSDGVPSAQSSSVFYGNRPGSLTGSHAFASPGYEPTYPIVGPPDYIPTGNRPYYPSYPGFQTYPYSPGYPIRQDPYSPGYPAQQYPYYPVGYPYRIK